MNNQIAADGIFDLTDRAAMDASAPPNECPTPSINQDVRDIIESMATCDYHRIVWESEQLMTHDVHNDGAHRVVRYEEAGVYQCRVVLLDPMRYERNKHDVAV